MFSFVLSADLKTSIPIKGNITILESRTKRIKGGVAFLAAFTQRNESWVTNATQVIQRSEIPKLLNY